MESWKFYFFKRHPKDDPNQTVPAERFLDRCPDKVAAKILAIINAVIEAPPPKFAGGGKWKAMHGDMSGFYEIRVDGPNRHHYRVFCILEYVGQKVGLQGPGLILITGLDKPVATKIDKKDYAKVRALGEEYRSRIPRSVRKSGGLNLLPLP